MGLHPRDGQLLIAALEGIRTPSLVAKAVMDHTDHHLLVGEGAQRFARNLGFTIEEDLNTVIPDYPKDKWELSYVDRFGNMISYTDNVEKRWAQIEAAAELATRLSVVVVLKV